MWVTDCAITDVDNWLCIYDDNSGMIGMLQGKYWSVARRPEQPTGVRIIYLTGRFSEESVVEVSREQYQRLEAEFGPRQQTID